MTLLGFGSGAVKSQFGEFGTASGQLSLSCTGIHFTSDGSHLVVAEAEAMRLSVFTVGGVLVRCSGVGVLTEGGHDVCMPLSTKGDSEYRYVVADRDNHRVCVFSA